MNNICHLLSFVCIRNYDKHLALRLFVLGSKSLRIRNTIIYRASNDCSSVGTRNIVPLHWPSQITRAAHIRSQGSDIEIISRKSQQKKHRYRTSPQSILLLARGCSRKATVSLTLGYPTINPPSNSSSSPPEMAGNCDVTLVSPRQIFNSAVLEKQDIADALPPLPSWPEHPVPRSSSGCREHCGPKGDLAFPPTPPLGNLISTRS